MQHRRNTQTNPYKISDQGVSAFMKENYPMKSVIGELPDALLIQSKKGGPIQQVPKGDIEAFEIRTGGAGYADDKAQVDNSNAANRFKNDAVYDNALAELSEEGKQIFEEAISTMTHTQQNVHKQKLRDRYSNEHYADHQYQRSGLHHDQERERIAQEASPEAVESRMGNYQQKDPNLKITRK